MPWSPRAADRRDRLLQLRRQVRRRAEVRRLRPLDRSGPSRPKPVYLHIVDDAVEILPAAELWGGTVWDTEESGSRPSTRTRCSRSPRSAVAGERGVRYACIVNDLHRAAGRSGRRRGHGLQEPQGGRGATAPSASNRRRPQAFHGRRCARPRSVLVENDGRKEPDRARHQRHDRHDAGVRLAADAQLPRGAVRGHRQHQPEAMERRSTPSGHRNLVTNKACFGCTIACGRIAHIDETHFTIVNRPKYRHALRRTGVRDRLRLRAAARHRRYRRADLRQLPDERSTAWIRYPLAARSRPPWSSIRWASSPEQDTDGVKLEFGNAEALTVMAEKTGKYEGFGQVLGLGSKLLCEKYGHPELSMAVKGQEFAGYDSRALQGMGLGFATSNRGACHHQARCLHPGHGGPDRSGQSASRARTTQDVISMVDSTGTVPVHHGGLGPGGVSATDRRGLRR